MNTTLILDRLAEAEHLAEVARLLSVFAAAGRPVLGRRELTELALQTAGLTHRYPNPVGAIAAALELRLISYATGQVRLTDTGWTFARRSAPNPADLAVAQGKILFALLIDHPSIRPIAQCILQSLRRGEGTQLIAYPDPSIWVEAHTTVAKLMQQCGALSYHHGALLLDREFETLIPPEIFAPKGLTEDELYKRLEAQRKRAADAEELVVAEERYRVAAYGNPRLVERVLRISTEDVGAGYDIISVEPDESPRYIEVKSSTGDSLRFEWSIGEKRRAREAGDRYWIYFVPLSDEIVDRTLPVYMFRNPLRWIESGAMSEQPTSWLVQFATPMPLRPMAATPNALVELPLPRPRTRHKATL